MVRPHSFVDISVREEAKAAFTGAVGEVHNPHVKPERQLSVYFAGYGGPQPPAPGSPGGKPRINRGPPGAQTPQQNQVGPYPGSPQVPRPTPPPGGQGHRPPGLHPSIPNVGNTLADLDPEQIPLSHKREGQDWFAIFNPAIRRQLDVELVHNLPHNSVVCCVRFSGDGRLVATGCNRSAQIFDVDSGQQVAHLQDPALPQDGDLYIRSVCFSPDGRYLATGAEDKIIRVSRSLLSLTITLDSPTILDLF